MRENEYYFYIDLNSYSLFVLISRTNKIRCNYFALGNYNRAITGVAKTLCGGESPGGWQSMCGGQRLGGGESLDGGQSMGVGQPLCDGESLGGGRSESMGVGQSLGGGQSESLGGGQPLGVRQSLGGKTNLLQCLSR